MYNLLSICINETRVILNITAYGFYSSSQLTRLAVETRYVVDAIIQGGHERFLEFAQSLFKKTLESSVMAAYVERFAAVQLRPT